MIALGSCSSDNLSGEVVDRGHDGKSFCVCHALFPNKEDRWEKTAKNLRGSIAEDEFEAFRSTVSLPFKPGERVQVKVNEARGTATVKTVRM